MMQDAMIIKEVIRDYHSDEDPKEIVILAKKSLFEKPKNEMKYFLIKATIHSDI